MIGFTCIALILTLSFTSACNRRGPTKAQLQERLESLTRQNQELTTAASALRRDHKRLLDSNEKDFTAFAAGMKQLNDTSEAIRRSMESFATYKRQYRKVARAKAPGTALGDIAYGSQTLRQVTIWEVTDTHIHVQHGNGSARIPLPDAPPNLQAKYGYDPSLDVVLKEATGTGTDWLLSAINSAQDYASTLAPSQSGTATRNATAATITSSSNVTFNSNSNGVDPQINVRPTWQRFSSFTGSYWAPLHQRKKTVGTVNSFSDNSPVNH
jgi:hypothetical protein